MPLVYQQNINEHTQIGLWQITENEDFFLEKVPLQQSIRHPHKRLQHLAGRYLLKILVPEIPLESIQIADTKKPFIPDEPYHFSISHAGDFAAVIISSSQRVGVDIEAAQQKIMRIKDKYLTEQEIAVLMEVNSYPELLLTMAWSIKESLFKWNAKPGIDFKKHLCIRQLELKDEIFSAQAELRQTHPVALQVTGRLFETLCLCWVIG